MKLLCSSPDERLSFSRWNCYVPAQMRDCRSLDETVMFLPDERLSFYRWNCYMPCQMKRDCRSLDDTVICLPRWETVILQTNCCVPCYMGDGQLLWSTDPTQFWGYLVYFKRPIKILIRFWDIFLWIDENMKRWWCARFHRNGLWFISNAPF